VIGDGSEGGYKSTLSLTSGGEHVMDGVTGSVYNDVVSSGQEMSDATRSCSGWHALWH